MKPDRQSSRRVANPKMRRFRSRLALESLEQRTLLAQLLLSAPDAMENDTSVTVTVSLAEAQIEPVRVALETLDAAAVGGRDFVPVTDHQLTFSPGQTIKQVEIDLLDNVLRDGDRSFAVRAAIVDEDGRRAVADEHRFTPPDDLFVNWLETSPDGSMIVYAASRLKTNAIYSVPADGSRAPIELARYEGDFYKNVQTRKFSADGQWIVYTGDLDVEGQPNLYIAAVDGSTPPRRIPIDLSDGETGSYYLSPNGRHIVYLFKSAGEDEFLLYSAPIDGSEPAIRISDLAPFSNIRFTPDGNAIVFQFRNGNDVQHYVAPVDGTAEARQVGADVPGSTWGLGGIISPDGQTLAFTKRDPINQRITSIFTSRLDGKGESKEVAYDIGSSSYRFSFDGKYLVYRMDKGIERPHEMFTVPVDGSAEPKILHPELTGSQWVEHGFLMIGENVLFRSNFENESESYSTYMVPSDGSQPPRKLLDPMEGRAIDKITPSPDGKRIVFQAIEYRDPQDDLVEIYSVPLDGSELPTRLSGEMVNGGSVYRYARLEFSSDGQDLYYFADQLVDEQDELFVVPVDGSAEASRVNSQFPSDFDVFSSSVYATESGVAYSARRGSFAPQVIYSSELHQSVKVQILDDEQVVADFGDAPDQPMVQASRGLPQSYPVTLSQNGARHNVGPLYLGAGVDADADGQPAAGGEGDDLDEPDGNEGARWLSDFLVTATDTRTALQVTASQAGKVSVWIDFDRDGDWGDMIDEVVISHDVEAGENVIPFTIPRGAIPGPTAARIRLSTAGENSPVGAAADGEVEDYWLSLVDAKSDPVPLTVRPFEPDSYLKLIADHVIVGSGQEPPIFETQGEFSKIDVTMSPGSEGLFIELGQVPNKTVSIKGTGEKNRLIFRDLDPLHPQHLALSFGASDEFQLDDVEVIDIADSERLRISIDDLMSIQSEHEPTIVASSREQLQFNDHSNWRMGDGFVEGDKFYRQLVGTHTLIADLPNPWQNLIAPTDVNNDGSTSVRDALFVINQIALQFGVSGAALPDPLSLPQWPGHYFDTNGDQLISPIDALIVVNTLERQPSLGGSAEAEFVASISNPGSQTTSDYSVASRGLDAAIDSDSSKLHVGRSRADVEAQDLDRFYMASHAFPPQTRRVSRLANGASKALHADESHSNEIDAQWASSVDTLLAESIDAIDSAL